VPIYTLNWAEIGIGPLHLLRIPLCDLYLPILRTALPSIIGNALPIPGVKTTCATKISLKSDGDRERLDGLLAFLKRYPLVPRTKPLDGHFESELSQAFVLGRNFTTPEGTTYTDVGGLEYQAKYKADSASAARLAELLVEAIKAHPYYRLADNVAAVPGATGKTRHLPDDLAAAVSKETGMPLLRLNYIGDPTPAKQLGVDDKIKARMNAFSVKTDVKGRRIVLLDDLFQSGATMFSVARMLKTRGAEDVVGLACVKSWRDSDNV
jgi:hypothetical protein